MMNTRICFGTYKNQEQKKSRDENGGNWLEIELKTLSCENLYLKYLDSIAARRKFHADGPWSTVTRCTFHDVVPAKAKS